jgi:hypothetical protein
MLDRLVSFLAALSLAFLIWLYARSRDQDTLDNVPIPVHVSLASGQADQYDLEVNGPSQIYASFTGPPSRIRELRNQLQRGELNAAVVLGVSEEFTHEARYSDTARVQASDIPAPRGLAVRVVEGRNQIPVTLHRLVERHLPVRFFHSPDERIREVAVEPATVLVRGRQEVLDRIRAIPTQPFSLPADLQTIPGQDSVTTEWVALVEDVEDRPIRTTPARVQVRFTIKPQKKIYELPDVPVSFLCPPGFALRPKFRDDRAARIHLKVLGPAGVETPTVTAFVDLTRRKFEPGLYADEPIQVQLPKDFQLAQNAPRSASFQLAVDPPAKEIDAR